jgi:hypothetical protein
VGDVLGIGLSHYPPLSGLDDNMSAILRWTLEDPAIPDASKDPSSWSSEMRREWGDDEGRSAAAEHRSQLMDSFRHVRKAIDEFEPDLVLIFGDDQYENFREDIIPPYAFLLYDRLVLKPWSMAQDSSDMVGKANIWDEGPDASMTVNFRPDIGRDLVSRLIESGWAIPYSYKPLHHPGLAHAFLNSVLYLDYDRRGFSYPILPVAVNCYGRRVVSHRGLFSRFGDETPPDPPAPSPQHLMKLGASIGSYLSESPWRVAIVASSSWSHAFLCDKTSRLRPDTESDMRLYDALVAGDLDTWRQYTLEDVEGAGQHELLNWFCLLGAMEAVSRPAPTWTRFVRSDVFNSNKVFCVYR